MPRAKQGDADRRAPTTADDDLENRRTRLAAMYEELSTVQEQLRVVTEEITKQTREMRKELQLIRRVARAHRARRR
jgi:hypothetical protein